MDIHQLRRAADNMDLPFYEAVLTRFRYVRGRLLDELVDMDRYASQNDDSSRIIFFTAWERFIELAHEQRALVLAATRPEPKGGITAEQIQMARDYPVNQIVEFDGRGLALAWCHKDRKPSLVWDKKRNRAHCFPCGRDFNSVDVLVERDGLNFIEAVRRLAA